MSDVVHVRGSGGAILSFDVNKIPESVLQRIARGEERFVDEDGNTVSVPKGLVAVRATGQPSLAVQQANAAARGEPIPGVDVPASSARSESETVVDLTEQMTLAQLQQAADARGLSRSGTKAEIADRILTHDAGSTSSAQLPSSRT